MKKLAKRLKKCLLVSSVIAAVMLGGIFTSIQPAMAGGDSDRSNGCYSHWWGTAATSNCTPATVSAAYSNQVKCSVSGFWHWRDGASVSVAAGQTMTGFNFDDTCVFSVQRAFTIAAAPY